MASIGDLVVKITGDHSGLDSSIDNSQKKLNGLAQTATQSFSNLAKAFGDVERRAQVFGNEVNVLAEKQAIVKKEIESLIEKGLKPESQEIQHLQIQYKNLTKEIEANTLKTKGHAEQLKKTLDVMGNVGRTLSIAVTAPLIAAGVAALKSAGQFQMYQASFETMLGDAAKAKVLIDKLQVLAAKTPFKMEDLAQASQTLLQYGITTDKLLPTIQSLGDVAQGNSEKFNRLALAFGQTQSTGRLMGQDLLQMINSGFNPLKVISDETGRSMGDLKKAMEKGGISAEMVAHAFEVASSKGGQFFNGMEKASKTLPGLMSTLQDDIGALGRSFAMELMPAVMNIVKTISTAVKGFTDLSSGTKQAILAGAGFVAISGPVLLAIKAIGTAFTTSTGPIGLVVAGVGLLVAGIIKIISLSKEFQEKQKLLDDAFKGNLKSTEEYNAALDLVGSKTSELKSKKEDLQKALKGEIEYNQKLKSTADLMASVQTKYTMAGQDEAKKKIKALDDEIEAENKKTKQIIKNRDEQIKKDKETAKVEANRMAEEAKALQESSLAYSKEEERKALAEEEAKRLLKEKEEIVKKVREATENAGLSDIQIIIKETELLKSYTDENGRRLLTDEQIQAYIEQTHKEYYENENKRAAEYIENAMDEAAAVQEAERLKRDAKEKTKLKTGERPTSVLHLLYVPILDSSSLARSLDDSEDEWIGYARDIASIMASTFDLINGLIESSVKEQADALDEELKLQQEALDKEQTAEDHARDLELAAEDKLISDKQSLEDKAREEKLSKDLAQIDERMQAELYAAGLVDASTKEQLESEIAAAIAANDTETAAELQKELDKLNITQKYEDEKAAVEKAAEDAKISLEEQRYKAQLALEEKRYQDQLKLDAAQQKKKEDLELAAARKRAKLEYDAAIIAWEFQLALAAVNAAAAIIKCFTDLGPVAGTIAAVAQAVVNGLQLAAIAASKPKMPTLAEGGIIPARPGGTAVIAGEARQDEAIIPLNRLDQMLSKGGGMAGSDNIPINLVIKMDSKVLYSGLFDATRRRDVLLSVGAMV